MQSSRFVARAVTLVGVAEIPRVCPSLNGAVLVRTDATSKVCPRAAQHTQIAATMLCLTDGIRRRSAAGVPLNHFFGGLIMM